MNEFFTYAIYNESRGKIYIGHTENLESRLKRHNRELPSKLKSSRGRNFIRQLINNQKDEI